MARRSKSGRFFRRFITLIALAAIALAAWMVMREKPAQKPQPGRMSDANLPARTKPIEVFRTPGTPASPKAPKPPAATDANIPTHRRLSSGQADAAYRRGMDELKANRLVEARTELSKAYFSGHLSPAEAIEARRLLSELAEITLIGPRSTVYPGDPYAEYYEFQPGEMLAKVERKLKLHVPWELIVKINGLHRSEDIQAHRPYKVVYGPFRAVISKSEFQMDIYLHREGLDPVFIRRLPVGTGQNGSTPSGQWRVRLGGKAKRATWYPPPNSPLRGPINYGEENYAFGKKGLWIALEGLDENTRMLRDYGIHSTNDQNSIGTAASLGCIRLADDDIELVYLLLYEHWSTVEIRP